MSTALPLRRAGLLAAVSIVCAAVVACASPGVSATTTAFTAKLEGAQEMPPTQTTATGTLEATFDKSTSLLKWRVVYSGLTGPATMAHFHGPAPMGANAGVVVPFATAASPIEGQATLSPAQAADLTAGRWYANVHSQRYPGGEIRGQVLPK